MIPQISGNSLNICAQFGGSFSLWSAPSSRPFSALTLQNGLLCISTQNPSPGRGLEQMLGQGAVQVSPALQQGRQPHRVRGTDEEHM